MTLTEILDLLTKEIHSVVIATTHEGKPVTRVIDVMMHDEQTFYFLTAKGKAFYEELMNQQYIALTGMCSGEDYNKKEASLHMKAISVRGEIENVKTEYLDDIFERNPYMADIYPTTESRQALEVFKMTKGSGEVFDLSTKPITRFAFTIGSEKQETSGYAINDHCVGCEECVKVCPTNCIQHETIPFVIDNAHCLHCGNCLAVCHFQAVEKF